MRGPLVDVAMKLLAAGAAAALLLVAAGTADARPGDLDRSFGDRGRLTLSATGAVVGLALLDDLRPWLSVQQRPSPLAVRLTAAGRVADRTRFAAPVTGAPHVADGHTLAEAGDGRLQLAPIGGAPVTLSLPTSTPTPFDVRDFGVDAAGRTVVFGGGDGSGNVAVRFLPDGTLDMTYGTNGTADLAGFSDFSGAVVKPDGRAFVFGEETQMALDVTGAPVAAYERSIAWPEALDPGYVSAVADGPGDTVLIAGDGVDDNAFVARIAGDGRIDDRFGSRGFVLGTKVMDRVTVDALVRDPRGRLVLGGGYSLARNRSRAAVLRFTASGRPDRTFGTRGAKLITAARSVAWTVEQIAVDARERIVIAGGAGTYKAPRPAIARLEG